MKKPYLLLLLPVLILVFLATGCSGPSASQSAPASAKSSPISDQAKPSPLERSDAQGAVTVNVTPLNLEDSGETLDFKVSLETHSVDLSMDLAALATLSTDSGRSVQAIGWDAPRGGHHVEGTLSFPGTADSQSLLEGAAQVTLTIQDLDAPERVFTWEISQ